MLQYAFPACLMQSSMNVHSVLKLVFSVPLYTLKNTLRTPETFLQCGLYLIIFTKFKMKTETLF